MWIGMNGLHITAILISVFDENHIAYCNWEYKGDFGIYTFDFEKNESLAPDVDLIHILTKK